MTIIEHFEELTQKEDMRLGAHKAILAIFRMDCSARQDLITYVKALNEAQEKGNEADQEYILNAILEVFQLEAPDDDSDLDSWEKELSATAGGRTAAKELTAETDHFFNVYQKLKAEKNLTTIRAVAEAAGLSPTTVQAIEKQRVKPQFKTRQALAKAFGVNISAFDFPHPNGAECSN